MSIEARSRQYGKVFDHWQIREFLGSGSGGKTAVFCLVRSDSDRGTSALKVVNLIEERGCLQNLSPRRREEYEAVRHECSCSAEQEVWMMDDLRGNTNIVDYLDHTFVDWSDESGFGRDLLIRMELLKDLRTELRNGRIFSEKEVLKIGRDMCNALIRCHRKNILHRDVKPENIFRNNDGDYKLGDFGVSRVLDSCPGAVASTGIGTYEYWPAEQMTGRYDKRVDIYSLGLVLYELCNRNRLPFAASTYVTSKEVSLRLAGTPLPAPVDAGPVLSKVILKACAFDPDDRYQSAAEFLKALNYVIRSNQAALLSHEVQNSRREENHQQEYSASITSSNEHPSQNQHKTDSVQKNFTSPRLNELGHQLSKNRNEKLSSADNKTSQRAVYSGHRSKYSTSKVIGMFAAYFLSCFWLMIPLILRGLLFFSNHRFVYKQYRITFDPSKCITFLSGIIFARVEDATICHLPGGISFTGSETAYGSFLAIAFGIISILVPVILAVVHVLKIPKSHRKKYAVTYLMAVTAVLAIWLGLAGFVGQKPIEEKTLSNETSEEMVNIKVAPTIETSESTPAKEESSVKRAADAIKIYRLNAYKGSRSPAGDNTVGCNQNGDTVWWSPQITLYYGGVPEVVQVYADFLFSDLEEQSLEDLWHNVANNEAFPFPVIDKSIMEDRIDCVIYMPDDPSLAGRHCMDFVLNSHGDYIRKTINFTLVYDGNYTTGTGWSVTDVVWN